jgi:hypothetical protein
MKSCSPHVVESMMASAGKRNPIPSIWIYSENDRYWGPMLPRLWYEAYINGGGRAEFHMLPAFGDDGHDFVAIPDAAPHWRPLVERFLEAIGYQPRRPPADAPAPTNFAPLEDVTKVPHVTLRGREIYAAFLTKAVPRAFAIARNSHAAYVADQVDVVAKVLRRCEEIAKEECRLYAVNDAVVWNPFAPAP